MLYKIITRGSTLLCVLLLFKMKLFKKKPDFSGIHMHSNTEDSSSKKHAGMKGDSLKMKNFSVSICKNVNNALQLELNKFWTNDFI